jgi:hypothetical protein
MCIPLQPANEEAGSSLKSKRKIKIEKLKIKFASIKKVRTFAVPKQTGAKMRE